MLAIILTTDKVFYFQVLTVVFKEKVANNLNIKYELHAFTGFKTH